ncbi:MAG: 4Fe-4S binding protein [Deltaproteobacteria bacterium]|nr:4Fe-4S binding protein [Deltaproteobacteria bacterium]
MNTYEISDECKKCGLCMTKCQNGAIFGEKKVHVEIDTTLCLKCGVCYVQCPFGAILKDGIPGEKGKNKRIPKAVIDSAKCLGCRNCYLNCPNEVIVFKKNIIGSGHCVVDREKCVGCSCCMTMCLNNCITIERLQDIQGNPKA